MNFPTPFTVGVHAYSSTSTDDYGRDVPLYTPAKNSPGTQHPVYGWATPVTSEPKIAGHDRVLVEVELFAPPGFTVGPHDLVDLPAAPSGQFEVIGYPEDYSRGPFGFNSGLVVNLRRVDG